MDSEKLIKLCAFLSQNHFNGPQLAVLALTPENNAAKISEIIGEKPANVYAAFKSLAKRGFILLKKNPLNRRNSLAELTDNGRNVMKELAKTLS